MMRRRHQRVKPCAAARAGDLHNLHDWLDWLGRCTACPGWDWHAYKRKAPA